MVVVKYLPLEFRANRKGLLVTEFKDRFGQDCVIQESSFSDENCIWLGVDVGLDGEPVQHGRMHLTQAMARRLIPVLRYFAREGRLGVDSPEDKFHVGGWVVGVGPHNHNIEGRVVSIQRGENMVVQNEQRPGVEGQIVSAWSEVDLIWEPIEAPSDVLPWYQRLDV